VHRRFYPIAVAKVQKHKYHSAIANKSLQINDATPFGVKRVALNTLYHAAFPYS